MHAEAALTLIAQARAVAGPRMDSTSSAASPSDNESVASSTAYDATKYGAATSNLREPDAVDAMELGARRMDFIGLKFQLADEMAAGYARALAASTSTDRKTRATVSRELSDLNGVNGRIQDLRNGYHPAARPLRVGLAALQPPLLAAQHPGAVRLRHADMARPRRQNPQRAAPVDRSEVPPTRGGAGHSARAPGNFPCACPSNSRGRANSCSGGCAMKTDLLTARRLITADGIVENPRIAIHADGTIASIEAGKPTSEAASAEETTLTPAFFDIHVHGAAGHDAMEGTPEALGCIGRFLATKGVAHFLATTVTAPIDRTLRALEGIADAIDAANATANRRASTELRRAARGHSSRRPVPLPRQARRASHCRASAAVCRAFRAACSKPRADTFACLPSRRRLPARSTSSHTQRSSGMRVSLGHSDATAEQTRAAIAAGATSATHTFNAMRRLDHREPGIAGVVLDAHSLYAELICDGVHVAPEFVRLWLRAKGEDRAILVTDGISATGMPDANYMLGELEVTVKNGRCLLDQRLSQTA